MATILKISSYNPNQPIYGPRLTDEEWETFKPLLVDLDRRGVARKEIVEIATQQYGFRGTYSALNKRFKKWGMTNVRSSDTADSIAESTAIMASAPHSDQDCKQSHDDTLTNKAYDDPENVIDARVPLKTITILPNSSSKITYDDLVLSTSKISVEDDAITDEGPQVDENSIPTCKSNAEAEVTISFSRLPSFGKEATTSVLQTVFVSSTDSSPRPVPCPSKRSHSQVGSFSSCEFGFGKSSETRSFMHMAKRIQQLKPTDSPFSRKSKFSWASSHGSQNFGAVTGFGPDSNVGLEASEDVKEPDQNRKLEKLNDAEEIGKSVEAAMLRGIPRFISPRVIYACEPDNSLAALGDIPPDEFSEWHPLSRGASAEFKVFVNSSDHSYTCRDAILNLIARELPVMNAARIRELLEEYPAARGIMCQIDSPRREVYGLLDRHSIAGNWVFPLLREYFLYTSGSPHGETSVIDLMSSWELGLRRSYWAQSSPHIENIYHDSGPPVKLRETYVAW